jgi:hypothetical protein
MSNILKVKPEEVLKYYAARTPFHKRLAAERRAKDQLDRILAEKREWLKVLIPNETRKTQ